MSSTTAPRVSRRPGFLVINSAFVVAAIVLGAWATWPIYQTPSFIILVVASLLAGAVIAFLGWWRGWSWFTVTLVAIGTYLLLGVPLGVPGAFAGSSGIPAAWLQFISATVFGWKQLVTVTIPVGTYQGLLVPALLLIFFSTVAALSLAWRARRLYVLAVPVLLLVPLFGLVFGSSVESERVPVLWLSVAPREFSIGLGALLLSLAFLIWRARHARRTALSAGAAAVVRQSGAAAAGAVRRVALAGVMVVVAVLVAGTVVPQFGGADRRVLRTAIDPEITINDYTSPLSQYRSYFSAEDYAKQLFTVSGQQLGTERVRLAVLSYFNGEVYSVVNPVLGDSSRATAFARIPSRLQPEVVGAQSVSAEFAISGYSGIWLPTFGALESVDFGGQRSAALTDGFFYSASSGAGVDLAGVSDGDNYSVTAMARQQALAVGDVRPPASSDLLLDDDLLPPNLVTWVRLQALGSDAVDLQTLIERLRARGYLSHALLEPTGDAAAEWMSDLGDYVFEPSLAGHSVDRIDALFGSLIEKQNDTRSTDDADLVAAVGDDEQFAVAAALVAQYLGFPSRIVLGFDVAGSDDPTISSCENGTCFGKNLIAWVEVQSADGSWAQLDVTPQHDIPVSPLNNQQRDPENLTEVLPDTASEEQPPEANPVGGDQSTQNSDELGADLGWLVSLLRVIGGSLLVVLVLLAPLLTIVLAKVRRRRARIFAPDAESRIVGGWDEYVDAALDVGKPLPTSETRTEIARLYGTPRGLLLATLADRAVFRAEEPDAAASEEFWKIVEAERRSLGRGLSRWQLFRAAISLRSFVEYVRARPPRSKG